MTGRGDGGRFANDGEGDGGRFANDGEGMFFLWTLSAFATWL
jgi:hypothetical protein